MPNRIVFVSAAALAAAVAVFPGPSSAIDPGPVVRLTEQADRTDAMLVARRPASKRLRDRSRFQSAAVRDERPPRPRPLSPTMAPTTIRRGLGDRRRSNVQCALPARRLLLIAARS